MNLLPRISLLLLLTLCLTVAACTKKGTQLEIEAGDEMAYNLDRLEAVAGETVTLTLTHTGQMPVEAMGHNVVILAQGVDATDFATAAVAAGADNGYIPEGREADIIAHTGLVGGGETTEIEFTAPEAGTYVFLCSFPGHSTMMQGEFVVIES